MVQFDMEWKFNGAMWQRWQFGDLIVSETINYQWVILSHTTNLFGIIFKFTVQSLIPTVHEHHCLDLQFYQCDIKSLDCFSVNGSHSFMVYQASRIHEEFFLPGEVIVEQGNVMDQLYVICHGEVVWFLLVLSFSICFHWIYFVYLQCSIHIVLYGIR